ncbi:hypothetical protein XA68_17296 [Ophiocordyceps unilateralis]|uniref:RxLR effector protein n=1 Tax=Ophiocordyceps unilateralis TaxID=268505 RepID=A0A2A9PIZ3_OPHUN|nr:hypothetical protein XA68_17296 [Ophiocordyceps unilateralis]
MKFVFNAEGVLAVLTATCLLLGFANGLPNGVSLVERAPNEASTKNVEILKRQQAKKIDGCKIMFSFLPWKGLDETSLEKFLRGESTTKTPKLGQIEAQLRAAVGKNNQTEVRSLMGRYCEERTKAYLKLSPEQKKKEKEEDEKRIKQEEEEDRQSRKAKKTKQQT